MKILIALLLTVAGGCFAGGTFAGGGVTQDISIPQTPRRVNFADVTVQVTPRAQQIINDQIRFLLTPEGEFLDRKMEKMQWYFPIIEEILEEEGVPDDFKYIAVLESSLDPNSVSTSNAVGFWQFKKDTAHEMGLRIDGSVDERKEIFQSTRAAANYLKRNNGVVNNWITALLTYNLGTGGVGGVIPADWSYAREVTFDENTHPYLIKALAHRIAFEHRINRLPDSDYQFVVYPAERQSLDVIASTLVMDVNELKKYNAWLSASKIPNGKKYNVLVPVSTVRAGQLENQINDGGPVIATLDVGFPQLQRVTPATADPSVPILYKINGRKGIMAQAGDEVPQLAAKANVGVYKFLRYNDMTEQDQVVANKVYYLQNKNRKAKVPYHTVAEGETMRDISQMYGIRMKNLLRFNRLKSVQRLSPGRVVWMQKKRPKNQPIEVIEAGSQTIEPSPMPREQDIATNQRPTTTPGPIIDRSQKPTDDVVIVESDEQLNKLFENENTANVSKPARPTSNDGGYTPATNTSSGNRSASTHTVQQGETLYSISRKYDVSVDDLRRWNNMSVSAALQSNQRLVVSSSAVSSSRPAPATTRPSTSTSSTASAAYHSVAPGETLYRISQNYSVSVEQLRSWNGLSDNTISVGQRLKVGAGGSSATPTYSQPSSTASSSYHTVAPGETLYRISVNNNVSVDQLKAWNNLSGNSISVGQKLLIKK